MALTLRVSDASNSSLYYDLNVNFSDVESDVLVPPPPPVLDDDTGAFDAALVEKNDASDAADSRLTNDRYYTIVYDPSDETLKNLYIPLNFPSADQNAITIKATKNTLGHSKLNGNDFAENSSASFTLAELDPNDNVDQQNAARVSLEVSRVAQTVTQTITLAAGWNLVSFNVIPTNLDLNSAFDSNQIFEAGDQIKSSTGFADYYTQGGGQWYGATLSVLEVGQGYLLKNKSNIQTGVSDILSITGTPVDLTTKINLSAGWNQIAFFPTTDVDLNEAFTDDTSFNAGDQIKSSTGFADYYTQGGGQWYGATLSVLKAGQGYLLKKSTSGTIQYK